MKNLLLSAIALLLPALAASAQDAPLYRLVAANDHLYTTSCDEVRSSLRTGWTVEGIEGSVWSSGGPGLIPIYRAFSPQVPEHFYTTSQREMRDVLRAGGRRGEGITGFVAANAQPGLVPIYRMLLPGGQHFYTTDEAEHNNLLNTARDESILGWISPRGSDQCHVLPDGDRFRDRRRREDGDQGRGGDQVRGGDQGRGRDQGRDQPRRNDILSPGQSLPQGSYLQSRSGNYFFGVMPGREGREGALGIFAGTPDNVSGVSVTLARRVTQVTMQPDGNLCATEGTAVVWCSNSRGPQSFAVLQDNGKLNIYEGSDPGRPGRQTWSSPTSGDRLSPRYEQSPR